MERTIKISENSRVDLPSGICAPVVQTIIEKENKLCTQHYRHSH